MIGVISFVRSDIPEIVRQYQRHCGPENRYASFDYCYRYFRCSTPYQLLMDMEKSCLTVGFYLASWGMFRGRSSLLQRSVKHYAPLVEFIAAQPRETWEIDVDSYNADEVDQLLRLYDEVRNRLLDRSSAHLTLVTKVLLGVFGVAPAFDTYFGNAFRGIVPGAGFRTFGKKSVMEIRRFYEANASIIDKTANGIRVLDFKSGRPTQLVYPKAKVIDMYGFILGGGAGAT